MGVTGGPAEVTPSIDEGAAALAGDRPPTSAHIKTAQSPARSKLEPGAMALAGLIVSPASLHGAAMLFEQFLGMRSRFDGDLGARQHAGELVHALGGFQPVERRRDRCAVADLRHTKVMIGVRSHLREMRDTEHLASLTECLQLAPDSGRNGAANAGVDFVENQCRYLADFARHHLDRQGNSRKLSAGRHAGQWTEGLFRMACDAELDVFEPMTRR